MSNDKQCEHRKLKPDCKGVVRLTKNGYLCAAHDYRVFLREWSGLEVHEDDYGAKIVNRGTMFDAVEGAE